MSSAAVIEGSTEIGASIDVVFAFVADARNDVQWCPRVVSCEQRTGDGPGVGARYEVLHNPTFQRPHARWIETLSLEAPTRVVTRQVDHIGDFAITYTLAETPHGTRLAQHDEITWKLSRLARPVGNLIVRRHIRDQLSRLRRLLESGPV
jgi:hypothetical protein